MPGLCVWLWYYRVGDGTWKSIRCVVVTGTRHTPISRSFSVLSFFWAILLSRGQGGVETWERATWTLGVRGPPPFPHYSIFLMLNFSQLTSGKKCKSWIFLNLQIKKKWISEPTTPQKAQLRNMQEHRLRCQVLKSPIQRDQHKLNYNLLEVNNLPAI